jgi:hypothetical protein
LHKFARARKGTKINEKKNSVVGRGYKEGKKWW